MDALLSDDLEQLITTEKLMRRFGGGSDRTWDRERAEMVRLGILVRRGNRIVGRMADVARFLMTPRPPVRRAPDDGRSLCTMDASALGGRGE